MSASYDFSGRNVLVSGGARGVGKATVEKFLKAGADVCVLDKDDGAVVQLLKDHPKVKTVAVDLSDWNATTQAVAQLGPIHHLVNDAGIGYGPTNFLDLRPHEIDCAVDSNLKAIMNVSQIVAKGIAANNLQGGTIVNIASVMSKLPCKGAVLYGATNAAVSMLSRCMALELEPLGIRVNTISSTIKETFVSRDAASFNVEPATDAGDEALPEQPAPQQEKMSGFMKYLVGRNIVKRLLTVEEMADLTLYLSTCNSSFLTGQEIFIDGGYMESELPSLTLLQHCYFISDLI